jgi:hypothetical protein
MTNERMKRLNEMSLDELRKESDEVYSAIQNEKIWMFGSAGDSDTEIMHSNNVDKLREESRYIFDLIEKRKGE